MKLIEDQILEWIKQTGQNFLLTSGSDNVITQGGAFYPKNLYGLDVLRDEKREITRDSLGKFIECAGITFEDGYDTQVKIPIYSLFTVCIVGKRNSGKRVLPEDSNATGIEAISLEEINAQYGEITDSEDNNYRLIPSLNVKAMNEMRSRNLLRLLEGMQKYQQSSDEVKRKSIELLCVSVDMYEKMTNKKPSFGDKGR